MGDFHQDVVMERLRDSQPARRDPIEAITSGFLSLRHVASARQWSAGSDSRSSRLSLALLHSKKERVHSWCTHHCHKMANAAAAMAMRLTATATTTFLFHVSGDQVLTCWSMDSGATSSATYDEQD